MRLSIMEPAGDGDGDLIAVGREEAVGVGWLTTRTGQVDVESFFRHDTRALSLVSEESTLPVAGFLTIAPS